MASEPILLDHLIDNAAAEGGPRAELRDPGNLDDVVALVAQADSATVDRAVRSAHAAFAGWRDTPLAERSARLRAAADALVAAADDVTQIVARESGMLPGTNKAEIGMAAAIVRDNADHAESSLAPACFEDADSSVEVEKVAVGVIAAIVPWNAPVILAMRKVSPALAVGNTVVVKTAPTAPIGLTRLLHAFAAHFPAGVVNVVQGGGETGSALVAHPLVARVSFTGGLKVAQIIMKQAAADLKRVSFELGGNDPAILLPDADLGKAVPRIMGGAFRRAGQFCFAVKRVYVPRALAPELIARMKADLDKFVVGHPLTAGVTVGPINNKGQFDYLLGLRERVQASGVTYLEGGSKADPQLWDKGYYMMPALVTDIDPEHELVTTEQFGPILPIVVYDDLDAVIDSINTGELGLGSSVWGEDLDAALDVARRIEAGMTFINNAGTSRLGQRYMPFGGVKRSGIGRESSPVGLGEHYALHAMNYHK